MTPLHEVIINNKTTINPVWIMRQAGRYLPEFRKIRSQNPDFFKLCFNSKLATEITLQPMKRFNLDAAIVFSDILVIPYALQQPIEFRKNEGPWNPNLNVNNLLETKVDKFLNILKPIYETIKITKNSLKKDKSLIAFVGAPWTLLIYLYNLKEQSNFENKIENRNEIKTVLQKLDEFLKIHIIKQREAGADVIQIFDSWAGLIDEKDLNEYCYIPNKSLVDFCKANNIPSICFPRGLKNNYKTFNDMVKPDAVNIDYEIDPVWAEKNLKETCIQGGLKPEILLGDKRTVLEEADRYLEIFKNKSYIFNLGHGILPKTDPEIIKSIVEKVNLIKR